MTFSEAVCYLALAFGVYGFVVLSLIALAGAGTPRVWPKVRK